MGAATSLEIIEHLDFEPEVPCEYSAHSRYGAAGASATLLIHATCARCGIDKHLAMCSLCYGRATPTLKHSRCGLSAPKGEFWTVVGKLGGRDGGH